MVQPLSFVCVLTCFAILTFTVAISLYIYSVDYRMYRDKKKGISDPRVLAISCNAGECVTNIQTGIKRCPADPATEACNPRTACTDPRTRHPVGLNGETLSGKLCPDGVTCNCSSVPMCPSDRASVVLVRTAADNLGFLVVKNENVTVPLGYRLLLKNFLSRCWVAPLGTRKTCTSAWPDQKQPICVPMERPRFPCPGWRVHLILDMPTVSTILHVPLTGFSTTTTSQESLCV